MLLKITSLINLHTLNMCKAMNIKKSIVYMRGKITLEEIENNLREYKERDGYYKVRESNVWFNKEDSNVFGIYVESSGKNSLEASRLIREKFLIPHKRTINFTSGLYIVELSDKIEESDLIMEKIDESFNFSDIVVYNDRILLESTSKKTHEEILDLSKRIVEKITKENQIDNEVSISIPFVKNSPEVIFEVKNKKGTTCYQVPENGVITEEDDNIKVVEASSEKEAIETLKSAYKGITGGKEFSEDNIEYI